MEWKKVSFKLKKTSKKIACYNLKLSRVLFLPFQSKIYLGNNYLSRTNKNLTKINRSFERIFLNELPSASLAALSLKYMCRANTLLHLIKSVGCWCHEWGKVSPHTLQLQWKKFLYSRKCDQQKATMQCKKFPTFIWSCCCLLNHKPTCEKAIRWETL